MGSDELAKKKSKKEKRKEKEVSDEPEEQKVKKVKKKDKEGKKDKKDKESKKKKKRKAESDDEEDSPKKEKKDKKDKKKKKAKKSSSTSGGNFNYYTEHSNTAAMSDADVEKWYQSQMISIGGSGCAFKPVLGFKEAGFPDDIGGAVKGFEKPTPIQSQCWPILLSGRDIVGIAATGSGKTLAFGMPGLVHIKELKKKNPKAQGPFMLVVAPTRELAMQSAKVLNDSGAVCDVRCHCIYGGVPKYEQRMALKGGKGKGPVEIIVATPGRLRDLMNEGCCDLSNVSFMCLDEADRMLDMGFQKDIEEIIGATNKLRTTAMFSATWPKDVEALARSYMTDEIKVTIGSQDLAASKTITQIVEVVEERDRDKLTLGLLNKYHKGGENKVLLFALYKKECARIEKYLQYNGFTCCSIHGDKSQEARTAALDQFRSGKCPLMIATDVAARGLDIPKVEYVINYSFPLTIEDYVHRIGRTGRAGRKGVAHSFFHIGDKSHAGELVQVLKDADQEVPASLMKFGTHIKKKVDATYGAFGPPAGTDMSVKGKKMTFGSDSDSD
jgi:ATP-dependent RNA helicase DBP3